MTKGYYGDMRNLPVGEAGQFWELKKKKKNKGVKMWPLQFDGHKRMTERERES